MTNPITDRDSLLGETTQAPSHDMDRSLPVNSPRNVVRKTQQLEARAIAGRHIDEALSGLPVSDEAKASRKAKLIELPAGTPQKRRGKESK